MNRNDYINKLRISLQGLPNSEIQDILSDYEEHFGIGISKGKSEEEFSFLVMIFSKKKRIRPVLQTTSTPKNLKHDTPAA